MGIQLDIRIDLSPRQKRMIRTACVAGSVVGALGLGVVIAAPKNTFTSGTAVSASKMNENFVDLDSRVAALESTPQRSQHSHAAVAGYGSVNTAIVRWTNHSVSMGSGITYAASNANGDSWTIAQDGIYAITLSIRVNGSFGNDYIAIGRNASGAQLTSSSAGFLSNTGNNGFIANCVAFAGVPSPCAWTGFLQAGDIIMVNTASGQTFSTSFFTITKVGG